MTHAPMSGQGYDAQRDAVRTFFAGAAWVGDFPGSVEVGDVPAFPVTLVAEHVGLSKTRAGDILVELERLGELQRAKHGRAFVYWRASDAQGVPAVLAADPLSTEPIAVDPAAEERVKALAAEDATSTALGLLHALGGKAYCGAETSAARRMIEITAAAELEAQGLVRLVSRRSYMIAELVGAEVSPSGTPQPTG